jgi:tetratricopeptide (TPR) repeat protein
VADRHFVYARAALIAGLAGLVSAIWVAPRLWARTTDFDRELTQLTAELASPPGPSGDSSPAGAVARRAFTLYRRATLTGRPEDFGATADAVTGLLAGVAHAPSVSGADLALLKAALDFRTHLLAATRADLASVPDGNPDAQLLLADVDLQDGLYDEARQRYESAVSRAPTWSALARLAYFTGLRGDADGGDRLYEQAEDDLTAKDMRAYAWVEVQRGWLQFSRGRYDEAANHYRLANRAYSGYWLVDEYTAELLGAQRKFDAAIALYEQTIARAPRPDLYQQLGDLCVMARKPREAARWHDRALAGYLEAAARGEVQYFHHLAAFYSDVRVDGAEAVKWARKDLEIRRGYAAVDTLAWALYRHGETREALDTVTRALASGMADGHLYSHAATIAHAAGRTDEADGYLAQLNGFNPKYNDFHVHR